MFPKTTVPQKNFKVKSTLKVQLFGEKSCSESDTCKCNYLQLLFRVFPTGGDGGRVPPLARNLLILPPPGKIPPSRLPPPTK